MRSLPKKIMPLLLVFVLLLSACSGTGTTTSQPESGEERTPIPEAAPQPTGDPQWGGSLNVTIASEPGSLDIMLDVSDNTSIPASHIFETLLTIDEQGTPQPMLCTYEQSEDGTVITLTLREGLTFHNGSPVTIEDVQATLERWLENVSFAQQAVGSLLESLEYPDDKTAVFTFTEAPPLALTALSNYTQGPYVMPKEILEAAGPDYISEFIGTGPYRFVEWLPDRHIKLERFGDYQPYESAATGLAAPKRAYVDEIYIIPVTDRTTRATGVQTGDYDVGSANFNIYEDMAADQSINVVVADIGIMSGMIFNCAEGPTADPKLRQAIIACLNPDDLMLAGEGDDQFYYLHPCWMTQSSAFYNEIGGELYYTSNQDLARQLIEESGYNGETLVYLTTRDYDYFYKTALLATDMMRQVGLEVDLQVVDNATLNDLRTDPGQYAMFSCGMTYKQDPTQISFLNAGWPGGFENYTSPLKDELIAALSTEYDPQKRLEIWEELCQELYDNPPAATFGERRTIFITTSRVQNMPSGLWRYYWNVWIDEQ